MKKLLSIAGLVLGIIFALHHHAMAQSGDIKLGGGLVFGTGVFDIDEIDNSLGIRAEGIYSINQDFRAGADLTFFFPNSEGDFKATLFAINLNGNYLFYSEEGLTAYGLAGLNIAIISLDGPTISGFDTSTSDSEIGLNLGGGVEYALDFADLFGELKFGGLGGNADQFVIGAGLRFPI